MATCHLLLPPSSLLLLWVIICLGRQTPLHVSLLGHRYLLLVGAYGWVARWRVHEQLFVREDPFLVRRRRLLVPFLSGRVMTVQARCATAI